MNYGKYIKQVCDGELSFNKSNEIENYLGAIIASGEKDSFYLLQFFKNDNRAHLYEVQNCQDNNGSEVRWWVEKMDLNIDLPVENKEVAKYNEYFDIKDGKVICDSLIYNQHENRIEKFIDALRPWGETLEVSCGKKIYIKGPYPVICYALQKILDNVEVKIVPDITNKSKIKIKSDFPPLMKYGVNLDDESGHITLNYYKGQETLIPLANETLDSPFFKKANNECNLTWRDLLPTPTSREDDITIGDYKCKLISVDQYKVDLFRNVFIKTLDHISKETKIVHVYDPFRNNRNIESVAYVGEVMVSPAEGETASNRILANINDAFKKDCNDVITHYHQYNYEECLKSVRNLTESLPTFLVYNMSADVNEAYALFSGKKKIQNGSIVEIRNPRPVLSRNKICLFSDYFFYKNPNLETGGLIKIYITNWEKSLCSMFCTASNIAEHRDAFGQLTPEQLEVLQKDTAKQYVKSELLSMFNQMVTINCFNEQINEQINAFIQSLPIGGNN